jgi:4-alpha-glucanotransferase
MEVGSSGAWNAHRPWSIFTAAHLVEGSRKAMGDGSNLSASVTDALRLLDTRNLNLTVHDPSFPCDADEDIGRGAPGSRGGLRFLAFVRELGFTGLQLGPDGQPPPDDPSPYRGTAFPRNVLSIPLAALARDPEWGGMLPEAALEDVVKTRPEGSLEHAANAHAARVHTRALRATFARRDRCAQGEQRRFENDHAAWLERYELFDALAAEHATRDVRRWGTLDARLWRADGPVIAERHSALRAAHADAIAFFRFTQFVAHVEHRRLAKAVRDLGLRLFVDLPIGLAAEDEWCFPELALDGYRMGAPPSRTTPAGQPWGYPVFDPSRYVEPVDGGSRPGPVLRFVAARLDRVLDGADAVRVDHPHGLVCPWVYDATHEDVSAGARLFESPGLPDHPALDQFAIVTRAQLNPDPRTPRWADDWVTDLEPEQVRSYAILLDAIVAAARGTENVVCEVLSTLPTPLARVLAAHGLGRFRVTQKAVLSDPSDVYRSENARPEDWAMVGTHDTPPIWQVADEWRRTGELGRRAEYLAWRLAARPESREGLARALAGDFGLLVNAQFADLFACPARNVMIFFPDLFGLRETYNVPGTVGPKNWSLRVPPTYADDYRQRLRTNEALNLPLALALALRARNLGTSDLLRALDAAAAGCV